MIMKTAITGANIKKNHMDILWHEYADKTDPTPITEASLPAKASVVGRVGDYDAFLWNRGMACS